MLQIIKLFLILSGLKIGIINKLTDFRDVFGKIINLFSDEKKDYYEIPKLRKEKNFPKHQKNLKSSFNKRTDTNNLSEEQFATLDQLMGFVK